MRLPRLFSSHLTRTERRVYGTVVGIYVVAFFAMIPPLFAPLNAARPLVLGMPLSLFAIACLVTGSFVVLLSLFAWETRRGVDGEDDE